jgi:hypothetical protein
MMTADIQLLARVKYLETALYTLGASAFATGAQAFTAGESTAIQQILKHENAHTTLLKSMLGSAAPAQPASSSYDFTAGSGAKNGPFINSLTTKADFLKVAQLIEDASVRAYKGQLSGLGADKASLLSLMQMHQVEARHASMIRRLRAQNGWISGSIFDAGFTGSATAAGTQASVAFRVYGSASVDPLVPTTSEDNRVQGSVANQNADSFDEPLSGAEVTAFAALFGAA